jgi:pyrroloquinoline quinone biosynthesis protein B
MARPQTQSSLAVSADGARWFLLNASPDLRQQIADNPQLHPSDGQRHSPIAGVVLTNADVDHVAGLLTLRESQPLTLYATERIQSVLAANAVFNVLNPDFVARKIVGMHEPFALLGADGMETGLEVELFAVPGKVALWLEDASAGEDFGTREGDTVGVRVRQPSSDAEMFYIPGCAELSPELAARLKGAPVVLFDGTLWQDREMIDAGLGVKTGRRMGHMSISGPEGTIAAFRDLDVARRMFIHLNNSNPVLIADSPERAAVEDAGWQVAQDGMEIEL